MAKFCIEYKTTKDGKRNIIKDDFANEAFLDLQLLTAYAPIILIRCWEERL